MQAKASMYAKVIMDGDQPSATFTYQLLPLQTTIHYLKLVREHGQGYTHHTIFKPKTQTQTVASMSFPFESPLWVYRYRIRALVAIHNSFLGSTAEAQGRTTLNCKRPSPIIDPKEVLEECRGGQWSYNYETQDVTLSFRP